MKNKRIILVVIILALLAMACDINWDNLSDGLLTVLDGLDSWNVSEGDVWYDPTVDARYEIGATAWAEQLQAMGTQEP